MRSVEYGPPAARKTDQRPSQCWVKADMWPLLTGTIPHCRTLLYHELCSSSSERVTSMAATPLGDTACLTQLIIRVTMPSFTPTTHSIWHVYARLTWSLPGGGQPGGEWQEGQGQASCCGGDGKKRSPSRRAMWRAGACLQLKTSKDREGT